MRKKYDFEKEVRHLIREVEKLDVNSNNYLLENTYFLKDGRVVCKERNFGVSRFPYGTDGFTLWAYSSGYISINESTFYLVLPADEGKEPYLGFFAGEKDKDKFIPISIMGRAQNPLESDIKRATIYSKECVYYLAKSKSIDYALRIFVTDDKKVIFTVFAHNHSRTTKKVYLSSYMNCLFKYANGESMETKWFKKSTYNNDVFAFESPEDINRKVHVENFGTIVRTFVNEKPFKTYNTTSRSVFMGNRENQLVNSVPLREGKFIKDKYVTHFTDTAIMGDINHYELKANESVEINYVMSFTHDLNVYNALQKERISSKDIEQILIKKQKYNKRIMNSQGMLKINFESWNNEKINTQVLNEFLKYVMYQTEYCGLAKNSGAMFLGVRDVMQQIEAALIWNPKACKKKILEVLSFIDSSGNPPRQYSIPPKGSVPLMDLRDFVDQGVWIISTIYTYLAYTKDYSILTKKVGYYDRVKSGGVVLSKRRDTVLDHMIQVMDYLITHIDEDTKCLRAMYGDWNDALDGLGLSKNPSKDYGNGVSIMATLQLYTNLEQMIEILKEVHTHEDLIDKYHSVHEEIQEGIEKFAIKEKNGLKRIVHGWGEDRSYYVGSFDDVDHKSRNSLTANAFYVISGMNKNNFMSKGDLLDGFKNLDSKYGLKTFEPYFANDVKGVGRIVNLPKGTAENGATYIHGALFGVMALFMLNEDKLAYEQIEKLLPISHKTLTTTPFVMPNSYSYNIEEDMDGESMSDWYTGSANTLIKTLIKGTFGINPDLKTIKVTIRDYYPSKELSCSLLIKGTLLRIHYQNVNNGKRVVLVNNEESKEKVLVFDETFLANNKEINIEIKE